ncbi:hypothetical protein KR093_009541, partial [Drosophila rubida]
SLVVFWIFLGLLALGQAASISTNDDETAADPCVSESYTWGTPALNEFKLCVNGAAFTIECNPNFYYVQNSTIAGCVPASLLDSKCIDVNIQPPVCSISKLHQMLRSNTLTHFYVCESLNAEPELLPCPDGKVFAENNEYAGCFDWVKWREVSGCHTY